MYLKKKFTTLKKFQEGIVNILAKNPISYAIVNK